MLNRRSFLKAGLTTGAAIPASAALNNLDHVALAATESPSAASEVAAPNLVALPPRVSPPDAGSEPWTSARTRVVWFKICPVLLAGSAMLLTIASLA